MSSRANLPSDRGTNLPALARLADLIVLLLGAAAAAVAITGGFAARAWGMRLSVRSPWRPLLWALALVLLRHVWMRRPSLWERLASRRIFLESNTPPAPLETRARLAMHAIVVAGFVALTCVVLFEQVAHLRSVGDLGDPLFSLWRLDWVAYQLQHDPLHLFDANIFHPEPRTLAYSDAMLVPALVAAPWLWLGADVVVVHNVLMLAASALSGVTMFWLVRELTRSTGAAVVSGAVFALYPLRWAFYASLELQATLWMPLALLWLHRTLATGRIRDGLAMGLAVAAQALSCLYYGLFLSLYLAVVAAASMLAARRRILTAVRPLAAGALLSALIVAPLAVPYVENRATVGERDVSDTAQFSARPRDYLAAHPSSRVYGRALPGQGKLELFPGVVPVALTVVGLWLPLSPGTVVYAAALGVSADASLGVNASVYPVLYKLVFPFRGLRAPDRFAVLVGLSLSVMVGYGVARMLRPVRDRRMRILLTAGLVLLVALESAPALDLMPVWSNAPPIYGSVPADHDAVLVDLPFPQRDGSTAGEYSFLYFATFHHKRLVNGGSGFYPPWYNRLADEMRDFPNDAAIADLKRHGAEYLVVHGYFYQPEAYVKVTSALDTRRDIALVAVNRWNGAGSRLYRILK